MAQTSIPSFVSQAQRTLKTRTDAQMTDSTLQDDEDQSCCCLFGKKKNSYAEQPKVQQNQECSSSLNVGKISIPTQIDRDHIGINSPREGLKQNIAKGLPAQISLLGAQKPGREGKKCLVLDLDETLVHSSFQPVAKYDFLVPVEIDGNVYQVYVAKRPHVDEFLKKMGEVFEIVIFTASLSKYADPVLDLLDANKVIDYRLFREHCTCINDIFVKDMSIMGRSIESIFIIDNSPHAYALQPENAMPCVSWFDDYGDKELLEFIPVLQKIADPSVKNIIIELERLKLNGCGRVDSFSQQFASSEEEEEDSSSCQNK